MRITRGIHYNALRAPPLQTSPCSKKCHPDDAGPGGASKRGARAGLFEFATRWRFVVASTSARGGADAGSRPNGSAPVPWRGGLCPPFSSPDSISSRRGHSLATKWTAARDVPVLHRHGALNEHSPGGRDAEANAVVTTRSVEVLRRRRSGDAGHQEGVRPGLR